MATSVAGMGVGEYDGQIKIIEYATERQSMRWNDAAGLWFSEARPTFRMKTDFLMGVGAPSSAWIYVSSAEGQPGAIGRSGFGWTPQAIHRANAAYTAGLVLQEKVDYLLWAWSGVDDVRVATVFFDLDPSDVISTLITATAGDHVGTELFSLLGERRMRTTGWRDSDIPTPTKALLAPHLYARNMSGGPLSSGPRLEFFSGNWRWKGDPTP